MSRIEDIKARLAAATPGPWGSKRSETYGFPFVSPVADMWRSPEEEANADLIAHAPTDLRDLVAVAETARYLGIEHGAVFCGWCDGAEGCPAGALDAALARLDAQEATR